MDNQTRRLYMLVAGATNYQDVVSLLQQLSDAVADVRTPIPNIGADDSIIVRRAVNNYLQSAIDNLRRIKNNQNSSSSVGED